MPRILVVLAPGAEEIETMSVADILVRADCEVCIAAAAELQVRGSRDLPLAADRLLAEVTDQVWDAVYIPGGMGSATFCSEDAAVQDLITRQLASDRLLAIICASPTALLPQGLAKGRHLTCYPALRDRFADIATWHDEPVVVDGNLVTSQGPGTAIRFGLVLAALLVSSTKADEVAAALLTDPSRRRSLS